MHILSKSRGRSALAAAAFASLALGGCGKAPAPAPPATEVEVTEVTKRDVPITQEWVASLYGLVDAQIRAQVSGYLLRQDYRDGAYVHRGDLLFEIDPRPFQAALSLAQAQLAQAEAQRGKTQLDVNRYGPLAKVEAISQQEYDDAVQANLAAQAQVSAAKAAVEQAQLNLDFTRIVSPVDGIAGIIQAQVGDLVGPSTGALTTVSDVDPLKVYFPVSEQSYLQFMAAHPDADSFHANVDLRLILSDGSVYPYPGKYYGMDREIDPNTGTVEVIALFPNPRYLLRPGQYGRVRATLSTLRDALVIPQRALTELQGGYQVAVVDGGNRAQIRTVEVGPQVGTDVVVTRGLEAGERVIVEGFQKVQDGTPVTPLPYRNAPLAAAAP